MHLALTVAFVVATQAPPSSAPLPAGDAVAPLEAPAPAAPLVAPSMSAPASDVDARYARTHAVLAAFADEGEASRITGAVASGILAAGLIGVGVTYVAVGNLDPALSTLDYEDTELAGLVIGGAAVIPASVMIAQLVTATADEERFAAFDGATSHEEKAARLAAARGSLEGAATSSALAPTLGGIGFIGGGLVSAAVGGVFLALPHIPKDARGPMTHATGAELIGAGVSSVGLGTALLFSTGSTAPMQLRLLDVDAPHDTAAAAE